MYNKLRWYEFRALLTIKPLQYFFCINVIGGQQLWLELLFWKQLVNVAKPTINLEQHAIHNDNEVTNNKWVSHLRRDSTPVNGGYRYIIAVMVNGIANHVLQGYCTIIHAMVRLIHDEFLRPVTDENVWDAEQCFELQLKRLYNRIEKSKDKLFLIRKFLHPNRPEHWYDLNDTPDPAHHAKEWGTYRCNF
eukprot:scaffold104284_cov64-Attheya_sp.AAC.4